MFRLILRPSVELRPLEERHAEPLFKVVDQHRNSLRQWLPWVDKSRAPADTLTFIRGTLEQLAGNEGIHAGIFVKNEFAGVIAHQPIKWENRKVEIGYWLSPPHQGFGIMTDACRALIDYSFNDLELHRVQIHCAEGNHKSRAIPERLAFQYEGMEYESQLLHGAYHNLTLYSMLAPAWRALQGQ